VDIELRQKLWAYVRELNGRGTTVLLTTHYLTEAEQLCDRIAIINQGRLIANDTTRALLRRLDARQITVTVGEDVNVVPESLQRFDVDLRDSRHLVFQYPPSKTNSGEILAAVQAAGLSVTDLATRDAVLEDIFLRLTRPRPAEPE
jgi:ABC-2 type transport system ATP-binding protein